MRKFKVSDVVKFKVNGVEQQGKVSFVYTNGTSYEIVSGDRMSVRYEEELTLSEDTYRAGDVFAIDGYGDYLLAQVGSKMMVLVGLKSGNRMHEPLYVEGGCYAVPASMITLLASNNAWNKVK